MNRDQVDVLLECVSKWHQVLVDLDVASGVPICKIQLTNGDEMEGLVAEPLASRLAEILELTEEYMDQPDLIQFEMEG